MMGSLLCKNGFFASWYIQLKTVYLTTASSILPATLRSEFLRSYYIVLVKKLCEKYISHGCINVNCQLLSSYLPM